MPPRLLSIRHAPPLSPSAARAMSDLGARGIAICGGALQAAPYDEFLAARARVFRRWALESLVLLHERPRGFAELARAVGLPPGQSMVNKLATLEATGLVTRAVVSASPKRVEYGLTRAGDEAAIAAVILALAHVEQVRAVVAPADARVQFPAAMGAPVPPRELPRALAAYARDARAVAAAIGAGDADRAQATIATARRFLEMCVRRWEVYVLATLMAGPATYGDIKRALNVGDESLSQALHGLLDLQAVRRSGARTYAIAPSGVAKLAYGAPVIATTMLAMRAT